ncbi:MAG: chemotaxis protein CheB [Candidatus Obscuribacterales bacterium]|nr:chemotaxis protein CheB [Candidatus Obscuribacterales bacterium]
MNWSKALEKQEISSLEPDSHYLIVAVAASAGGLTAISTVLKDMPADLPAAILVVQHLDPRHRSMMSEILRKKTRLRVKQAEDGEILEQGVVYIAPPDYHLLVVPDGRICLNQSEQIHFVRPSAEPLFESVAACYKDRSLAIVLSGTGKDGSTGLKAIKEMGGRVIVQDENSAQFSGMPAAAMKTGFVDWALNLEQIGPKIVTLVNKEATE